MEKEVLIKEFAKCLQDNRGAIFIGAGISRPSGFKSWFDLIRMMEKDIDVKINKDDNLLDIAQYIVNANSGNRGRLLKVLEEHFTANENTKINDYHKYLAETKVKTIWTTNYDTMLEKAFYGQDVIVRRCENDMLPRYITDNKIEIIKMHGCIENPSPENIVLTKEDYEDYSITRPLTIERLRNDLMNKSFLFIGYSYRDSNIQNIMNQVRHLCKKKIMPHYMILEKEKDERTKKIQKLWSDDLLRYGIHTCFYEHDDHGVLVDILNNLSLRSRGNTIYVTGSHIELDNKDIVKKLGAELAKLSNIKLINGQSEGIGKNILNAFIEYRIKNKIDLHSSLEIYPNPYAVNPEWDNTDEYLPELKKFRRDLMKNTHIMIMFDGAKGTNLEYKLALEVGSIVIPVKCSDSYSQVLKDAINNTKVIETLEKYDKQYANKLKNNENVMVEDILQCIKNILDME